MVNVVGAIATTSIHVAEASEKAGDSNSEVIVAFITALASIIGSAAWPLALFGIIFLLRTETRSLIGRISAIRYGEAEVSLDKAIKDSLPEEPGDHEPAETADLNLQDSDNRAPIDAIVIAWVSVERAIEELVGRVGLPNVSSSSLRRYTVSGAVRELSRRGILNPLQTDRIRELQSLRNLAVHRPEEPTSAEAVNRYVQNASEAVAYLRSLPTTSATVTGG